MKVVIVLYFRRIIKIYQNTADIAGASERCCFLISSNNNNNNNMRMTVILVVVFDFGTASDKPGKKIQGTVYQKNDRDHSAHKTAKIR